MMAVAVSLDKAKDVAMRGIDEVGCQEFLAFVRICVTRLLI